MARSHETAVPEYREPLPKGVFLLNHTQVQTLLRNNRTTLILNRPLFQARFGKNGELFNPELCDPIRLVKVRQYDGTTKTLIEDGNHRTVSGESYGRRTNLPLDQPYLPARDITTQYSDTGFITPEQFLSLVIIPTKEHTKIAPERMAYNLFSQWEQMMGPEVSQQFSILGALAHQNAEAPSMIGIPTPEQKQISIHLSHLRSIVSQAKYSSADITSELLALISKHPDNEIIDPDQATRLIQGLFFLPNVAPKIIEAFGDPSEDTFRQDTRALAVEIVSAMTRFKEKPTEIETIYTALLNDIFSVDKLRQMTHPPDKDHKHFPSTLYREFLIQQRYETLLINLQLLPDSPEYTLATPLLLRLAKRARSSADEWEIDAIATAAKTLAAVAAIDTSTLPPTKKRELERARKSVENSSIYSLVRKTSTLQTIMEELQQKQTQNGTPASLQQRDIKPIVDRNALQLARNYTILLAAYLRLVGKKPDDLSFTEKNLMRLLATNEVSNRVGHLTRLVRHSSQMISSADSLIAYLGTLQDPHAATVRSRLLSGRKTVFNPVQIGTQTALDTLEFLIGETSHFLRTGEVPHTHPSQSEHHLSDELFEPHLPVLEIVRAMSNQIGKPKDEHERKLLEEIRDIVQARLNNQNYEATKE